MYIHCDRQTECQPSQYILIKRPRPCNYYLAVPGSVWRRGNSAWSRDIIIAFSIPGIRVNYIILCRAHFSSRLLLLPTHRTAAVAVPLSSAADNNLVLRTHAPETTDNCVYFTNTHTHTFVFYAFNVYACVLHTLVCTVARSNGERQESSAVATASAAQANRPMNLARDRPGRVDDDNGRRRHTSSHGS